MPVKHKYFHICPRPGGTGLLSAGDGKLSTIYVNDFVRKKRDNDCPNTFLELWNMFVNVYECKTCDHVYVLCAICNKNIDGSRGWLVDLANNILAHLSEEHNMVKNDNILLGVGLTTLARLVKNKFVKIMPKIIPYMLFIQSSYDTRQYMNIDLEDCNGAVVDLDVREDHKPTDMIIDEDRMIKFYDFMRVCNNESHTCAFCDYEYDAFPTIDLFNLHIRNCAAIKLQ